jgi:hypothetical protein
LRSEVIVVETILLPRRLTKKGGDVDQPSDLEELERKLEQARRLAARTTDLTTFQRLVAFVDELKQNLRRRRAERRSREAIRARAHELWERNGRPAGKDVEFWLAAERELEEEAGHLKVDLE